MTPDISSSDISHYVEKSILHKIAGAPFRYWNQWREGSINRRIFSAILIVGGFSIVVKLAATFKQLVIAYQFGTSDALDAFLIAYLIPSFAINVFAGSFSPALMPTFIQVREKEGMSAAQQLFSSVLALSILIIFLISFLLVFVFPYLLPIIGSNFNPDKQALTQSLFYMVLPIIVISGLTAIWACILNAGERFALAAFTPIMTPIMTIIALMLFGSLWGIYSLAIGTVCGFFMEAALLSIGLKRLGLPLFPRWHGFNPKIKQVLGQYLPMVAGSLLMVGTDLIDQAMAAMLNPGSVSALNYGNKIVALFLGVGSLALSTAIFPHFSRMVSINDWSGIRHTLKTYSRIIIKVSVPCMVLAIFFSESIVDVLFNRGAFTESDTHLVALIQRLYLLQIPFYILGIMGVRLLSALKRNQAIMIIAAINLFINIIGNLVFIKYFGVAGISLSTSVVYAISMVLIFISLNRYLRESV
jgi:putative peptidoglycan lipid II flippase